MYKKCFFLIAAALLVFQVESSAQVPFTRHLMGENIPWANTLYAIDLDRDGDVDLAGTAGTKPGKVFWFENLGAKNFQFHLVESTTSSYAVGIYAGDFNGDGFVDLVAALTEAWGTLNENEIVWYENDGYQNFAKHTIYNFYQPDYVSAADVDDDGDLDILGTFWGRPDNGKAIWWENNGAGQFTTHMIVENYGMARSIIAADFDGDGDKDVATTQAYSYAHMDWWENDGSESFTRHPLEYGIDCVQMSAFDLDQNGIVDMLYTSLVESNPQIAWLSWAGATVTKHVVEVARGCGSGAADLDLDGDLDIIANVYSINDIYQYLRSAGAYSKYLVDDNNEGAFFVAAADFDNDGDIDFAVPTMGTGKVLWYENMLSHPPVADAGSDQTLCAGSAITIGGDPTGSGGMGGPYTFSWSPTAGLDDPTAANPNASPVATTTYTVTVTETATGLSDTDEMTLTVNPAPSANAGADKLIAPGQTVAIGGDPTAAEGTPPYSYSWSPSTGLDDPTASNPNATLTGTMTYSVEVTDDKGCKATDEVTINVHGYALLANQHIEVNRNKLSSSKGVLHSNNTLYFKRGDPTTFTGNLEAVGNITIDKENRIVGDVTAGGAINLHTSSTITGAMTEHGVVEVVPIWMPSFSAGGTNYKVPANGALTLAPGSYGSVCVGDDAKLYLSSGKYYFTKLETQSTTELHCNVSAGVVQVHVTSSLKLGKETEVLITPLGEAGSEQVCFMTQQSTQVLLDKESYVLGTLLAPNAEVFVGKNTSYRGAICAQRIIIERDVTFLHHDSPGALPLPKASFNEEAAASASAVPTQYELLQNYPNPFSANATFGNPTTEIRFALPQAQHVVVKIFNTLGEEIRTLVNAPYEAGYHRVLWDGKDEHGNPVASGVYLYQMRAGEFAQVRKMSLLR